MAVDGGPVERPLTCTEDGVETRLRCCECQAPICPDCFVRTLVGLRCRACGADTMPVVVSVERRRRGPVVVAVGLAVALVAGGAWAALRGVGPASDDGADVEQGAVRTVGPVTLGTGDLGNGAAWTLVARRDGRICLSLSVSTAPPSPEQCQRPPGNRAFSFISRRAVAGPGGPAYVTFGLVSDQVERIRVVPQGTLGGYEVATLGADAGLGGRFFVTDTPDNGALSLTALSANGNQLGRANLAQARTPPPG